MISFSDISKLFSYDLEGRFCIEIEFLVKGSPSISDKSFTLIPCDIRSICGISTNFSVLSLTNGQVTHALLTRPPLSFPVFPRRFRRLAPLDLHVLGTPPAFVLSQDQTLDILLYISSRCLYTRFVC